MVSNIKFISINVLLELQRSQKAPRFEVGGLVKLFKVRCGERGLNNRLFQNYKAICLSSTHILKWKFE